jgi:hypothetical protein
VKPYLLYEKRYDDQQKEWVLVGNPFGYDSMDEVYAKHGAYWPDQFALFRRYTPRLRKTGDG